MKSFVLIVLCLFMGVALLCGCYAEINTDDVDFERITSYVSNSKLEFHAYKQRRSKIIDSWLESVERVFNKLDEDYYCELEQMLRFEDGRETWDVNLINRNDERDYYHFLLNIDYLAETESNLLFSFVCPLDNNIRDKDSYPCKLSLTQLPWTCLSMINGNTYAEESDEIYNIYINNLGDYWFRRNYDTQYVYTNPVGNVTNVYYFYMDDYPDDGFIYIVGGYLSENI